MAQHVQEKHEARHEYFDMETIMLTLAYFAHLHCITGSPNHHNFNQPNPQSSQGSHISPKFVNVKLTRKPERARLQKHTNTRANQNIWMVKCNVRNVRYNSKNSARTKVTRTLFNASSRSISIAIDSTTRQRKKEHAHTHAHTHTQEEREKPQ